MTVHPKTDGPPPDRPTALIKRSWKDVLKRTVKEYQADNLSDWAAALTYRAVMSLFPGILVLVALLGLTGRDTAQRAVEQVGRYAPGAVRQVVDNALTELQRGRQG